MALRASQEDVRSVLQDSDADVIDFLILANQIVDAHLLSSGNSTTMLKQIEIYIACHLYSQIRPDIIREKYGDAEFQYANNSSDMGQGLASTKWGKLAIAIDTSGILYNLGRRRVALHLI